MSEPHDLVKNFLELHEATGYDWHTTITDITIGSSKGHEILLSPLDESDEVLFHYSGPSLRHRAYRFFKPGEHRHQTEESMRRLFA